MKEANDRMIPAKSKYDCERFEEMKRKRVRIVVGIFIVVTIVILLTFVFIALCSPSLAANPNLNTTGTFVS